MTNQVRVRFAPSPTGHLHIGGARAALFSYLFARNKNGKFIVRFEDTDQIRNVENAEGKMLASLKWLGIDWDESVDIDGEYGPYRCSDRLDIYKTYINQLLEQNKAYNCYCTPEELEKEREEQIKNGETAKYSGRCKHISEEQKEKFINEGRKPNVRFIVSQNKTIYVKDIIRGNVEFEAYGIGDFVLMRPNGMPTYNFAVTVDDYLMKISHVIRGEEHLTNTPRQLMLYEAFSWEAPQFAHVSLILNQDRQKMSKRDESIIQFIEQYQELGFLPEAILNFLALMGWSPEGEKEIFSKEELIKYFSLERVIKSPAIFNVEKLLWMNNYYIKEAKLDRIVDLCLPHLKKAGYISDKTTNQEMTWFEDLINLYKEQLNCGEDIIGITKMFLIDKIEYEEEPNFFKEEYVFKVIAEFSKQILDKKEFTPEIIKECIDLTQEITGYKGKKLYMSIRIATTGVTHGRDLPNTLYLLGKEKILLRMNNLLTKVH
ncbi:MAG: glutamate--tRNA ligase [Vulcanibacillus sp.]